MAHQDYVHLKTIDTDIRSFILQKNKKLTIESQIPFITFMNYHFEYIKEKIIQDQNETKKINQEMLEQLKNKQIISQNLNTTINQKATFGQKSADAIAKFGGSWPFIFLFVVILGSWILLNTLHFFGLSFDRYPFILLNLVLSCLAAIQAPIIMMSQNRQATRDRIAADHDYQTNLKAELEISLLHEKIDYLMSQQWQQMLELQQLQIELLTQLNKKFQETTKSK
ncbi:cyclic nucleotide-binding protein [Enterococcus hirae 81-15-F4]|nr:cyclic nucleotide-binding protein [Enterococcus hirae 81-15-F4]